jgi:hypothetical protein
MAVLLAYVAAVAVIAAKARARPARTIAASCGRDRRPVDRRDVDGQPDHRDVGRTSGVAKHRGNRPLACSADLRSGELRAPSPGGAPDRTPRELSPLCGAMLCVAAAVALGWTLDFLALPTLERVINGSPEYLASHWGDLHAFVIANSLDSAFTHLCSPRSSQRCRNAAR